VTASPEAQEVLADDELTRHSDRGISVAQPAFRD